MIVIHMQWTEGNSARQETYGPWTVADDESHLEQIFTFMKGWRRLKGQDTLSATMALVTDPQEFTDAGAAA